MGVSVVVPAHNEAAFIVGCLASIEAAAERIADDTEVVVVVNRCTDDTADLALARGARVVESDARNIAAVRNAGVAASTGDVVITIDADCRMSPYALRDIAVLMATTRTVGGGTLVVPERWSAGIRATYALVATITTFTGLSGGMFWCRREDFDAIGGFDEGVLVGEDLEFAARLKAHGRRTGRRLTMLRTAPVVASCRKFDRFGDWHMFRMALELPAIGRSAKGTDTAWVDRYFFDFND